MESFAASETEVDETLIRNEIMAGTASHVSHFLTLSNEYLLVQSVWDQEQSKSIYKDIERLTCK